MIDSVKAWGHDEIYDYCRAHATTDITTAGEMLGLGRTKSHELYGAGQFPVPVLVFGPQSYRVPTAPLLRLLGLAAD